MKRRIALFSITAVGILWAASAAASVLSSAQVGTGAAAGSVLQTNGVTSTWVATSSLGISGSSTFARAVTKTVCASNAVDVTNCDYKAAGADDGVIINTAISAIQSSTPAGGTVYLSEGTFNVSTTIKATVNGINLEGAGQLATIINVSSTNTTYGIHWGNGQANTSTGNIISNVGGFTIKANNTSTVPLWMDGMGQGTVAHDIDTQGGKYGAIFEDVDRANVVNVRASSAYAAGIVFREGIQNTFGKLYANNIEAGPSYNSSTGILFDVDSDQGSPNSLDAITIVNSHMQENNGISSGTGMAFNLNAKDVTLIGNGFEDSDTQFQTNGHEVDATLIGNSMINSYRNSLNCVAAGGYANLTFIGNGFQQCTNGFNGGAGYPNFIFDGSNKNNGNIANLFAGGIASKQGTDVTFAGAGNLVSGLQSTPYSTVYTGTLQATSTSQSNVANLDGVLFADSFPGADEGAKINAAYASMSASAEIFVGVSSTITTPIVFGTSGKYASLVCAPGVQLSFGASATGTMILDDSGGTFYHTAHVISGCLLNEPTYQPAGATTTAITIGKNNGSVALTIEGVTVTGFGVGLQTGYGSFMDQVRDSVFRNDNQAVNQQSSNYSGENMSYDHIQVTDCGNNTTTKCFYMAPYSSGDTTISNSSFDDAALFADYDTYSLVLLKDHFENSNVGAYGSYIPVTISSTSAMTDIGSGYNNDSGTSGNNPAAFIKCNGATLNLEGTSFQSNNGQTLTSAVTSTGACAVQQTGVTNVNSAITNVYNGGGIPMLAASSSLVVAANGNVGIGLSNPAAALDVNGNINIPATSASAGQITQGGLRVFHTYGTGNIFAGSQSGNFSLTGTGNAALGTLTLSTDTTGTSNVAMGYQALTANTTGNFNVGIGQAALLSNTTGNYNVGIGYTALSSLTTGSGNIAFGYGTLATSTGDSYNTAIGYLSQNLTNGGTQNSSIGYYSLLNNSTGNYNSAFGVNSLYTNTTGINNTGLGVQAGYSNSQGIDNTFVGFESGDLNSTANYNTAVGTYASLYNATGTGNTSLGYAANYLNNGSYQTAIGQGALQNSVTPGGNTALGYAAAYTGSTTARTTAVGYTSLFSATGNDNTAVGDSSGYTVASGAKDTLIGSAADVSTSTLTNATAIGYAAKVGESNALVLGGTGANAVSVGIGTAAPSSTLHVVGNSEVTSGQFFTPVYKNATSTASTTAINWNNGNKQQIALGTSTTFTLSNVQSGGSYSLWIQQDASGSRTAAWTSSGTGRVQWASSTAPTLSTGANAMDEVSFQCFVPNTTTTLSCYGEYGPGNFVQ